MGPQNRAGWWDFTHFTPSGHATENKRSRQPCMCCTLNGVVALGRGSHKGWWASVFFPWEGEYLSLNPLNWACHGRFIGQLSSQFSLMWRQWQKCGTCFSSIVTIIVGTYSRKNGMYHRVKICCFAKAPIRTFWVGSPFNGMPPKPHLSPNLFLIGFWHFVLDTDNVKKRNMKKKGGF